MTTTYLKLNELSPADRRAWSAIRAADPDLASPYFSLAYLDMVETARPGVRIARLEQDGEVAGFLPFCTDPFGTARPAGGPLCDLHGPVIAPDRTINLTSALKSGPVRAYAYSAVPYANIRHGLAGQCSDGNHVIDLSAGYDRYIEARSPMSPEFRRIHRKAMRIVEAQDTQIQHDVVDAQAFERLIELKQDGYDAAGHFNVFSLNWPKPLLQALLASEDPSARGVMSTLSVDGEQAAIFFGMRSETVLHYWFPAYEPAFAKKNVGHALLFSLADWATSQSIQQIHLGLGDYRYKVMMSSYQMPMQTGAATFDPLHSLAASIASWSHQNEATSGFAGLSAKLCRKIDRVCTLGTLAA